MKLKQMVSNLTELRIKKFLFKDEVLSQAI